MKDEVVDQIEEDIRVSSVVEREVVMNLLVVVVIVLDSVVGVVKTKHILEERFCAAMSVTPQNI